MPHSAPTKNRHAWTLTIGALGVVFGDIGTSPLYALKECFSGMHAVPADPVNILGVLSLITWSLILVVSVEYVCYVTRADNDGEGGVLALLALICPMDEHNGTVPNWLLLLLLPC